MPCSLCWASTSDCPGDAEADVPHAGLLGFYKGMRAKIVQSILAAALLMAVKEQMTTTTAALLSSNSSVIATATPSKATVVQLAELSAAK